MEPEKPTTAPWGIYDTKDNCWMGNDAGPLSYTNREINGKPFTGETLARAAATIVDSRLKTFGRIRARLLPPEPFTHMDTITPPLDAVEAMKRLGI